MLKHLLSTTAIVVALSTTAWAQTSTSEDPAMDQGQATGEMNAQPTDQPEAATGDAAGSAAGTAETEMQTEDPAAGTAETDTMTEDPAAGTAETDTMTEDPAAGTAETDTMTEDPAAGTAETDTMTEDPAAGTADTGTMTEDSAADTAATGTEDPVIPAEQEGQLRAEDLMGMTVVSGEGERIGEVQDLIFDENEAITGVVVGVGGFLGIGEKRVGLNWDQAEVQQNPDTDEEVILVNLSKEELEAAPEFQTTEEQAAEEEAGAVEPLPAPTTGTGTGTATQ